MKKLMIVVVGLLIAVPAVAMELCKEKIELKISKAENDKFVNRLALDIQKINSAIVQGKLDSTNPMCQIFTKLSNDLFLYKNDVLDMIKQEKYLEENLKRYITDDKQYDDVVVPFCLKQIRKRKGNVEELRELVVKSRQLCAEALFENLHRDKYVARSIFETTSQTDWMLENAKYPVDEYAMKQYISLLFYQHIFAPQID